MIAININLEHEGLLISKPNSRYVISNKLAQALENLLTPHLEGNRGTPS
jgi:hypothetical protein